MSQQLSLNCNASTNILGWSSLSSLPSSVFSNHFFPLFSVSHFVLSLWNYTFLFSFILNILAIVLSSCLLNRPPFSSQIHSYQYQFSCLVLSDSLQPHGLQHIRPPCPSPTPRIYSNSCTLSWWYHPTISSSAIPFSSSLQSSPAAGSFPMSQLFTSGQRIGVSASASDRPMNIQDWFPLGWTGWIALQSKGLSRVFSDTTIQKHQFFSFQHSHPYMTTGKTIAVLTRWTFVGKVMSLLFNMLSRLVITFFQGASVF